MLKNRPITECLTPGKAVLSVEFFPPRDEAGEAALVQAASAIRDHVQPDFVSITYGAGGSTRERTFRYAQRLKDDFGFNVMPHLTCVGSSNDAILETVQQYVDAGFGNLMALRGDPPKGSDGFQPHPDGPRYASDLVRLLRGHFAELCIGVAGYPETHPEAPSADQDLAHLKHKVDQGASFVTTQLFYNNARFFDFVQRSRKNGIRIPILPGLMPLFSAAAARRFCDDIPPLLAARLEAAGSDRAAVEAIGLDWAFEQSSELLRDGAPGIHLYIMNRSELVIPLVQRLRAAGFIRPHSFA